MNELFLPSGTHKEEKTASSLLVAALCDENLIGYRIACLSLDRANPKPVFDENLMGSAHKLESDYQCSHMASCLAERAPSFLKRIQDGQQMKG